MKKLLSETAAYASLCGDAKSGRLSHAYMLVLDDKKNMRFALKFFALAFLGLSEDEPLGRRLTRESLSDCRFYPEEGKKFTADGISRLADDCALAPLELPFKLYVLCGFDEASAIIQNKMLRLLEEPPAGVKFLLGVRTVSSVLETVLSRVRKLTVPPFSDEQIRLALDRKSANALNAEAAESCGGSLGVAENMVSGDWLEKIRRAAAEICTASTAARAGELSVRYSDVREKAELLGEMQRLLFCALKGERQGSAGKIAAKWSVHTLIYACERISEANADVKFNANFQALLFDFMLGVIKENEKWSELRE